MFVMIGLETLEKAAKIKLAGNLYKRNGNGDNGDERLCESFFVLPLKTLIVGRIHLLKFKRITTSSSCYGVWVGRYFTCLENLFPCFVDFPGSCIYEDFNNFSHLLTIF